MIHIDESPNGSEGAFRIPWRTAGGCGTLTMSAANGRVIPLTPSGRTSA